MRKGSGTYVGIRYQSYLIVLFGHHQLVWNAGGSLVGGGQGSGPAAALVCGKGRVFGVRGKGLTLLLPCGCSVWPHRQARF